MRARKNVANLSSAERAAFVGALLELHRRPSQRGLANRYDDFAKIHVDAMSAPDNWGHRGPVFTAWHRVLLDQLERELRAIDDSVRIPFWDWTVDRTPTSPPWLDDLLGRDGGPDPAPGVGAGEVTTGPFRYSEGDWTISTTGNVNDDPLDRPYLARGFGREPTAPVLPTAAEESLTLGSPVYSLFVDRLEGDLHNLVHRWVNGQMNLAASPHDPVFWLHHCNIDRLWGIWMRGRTTAERYTADPALPAFQQPTGTMVYDDTGNPPWSGTYRPIDTLDDHAFGVWYEGDPPIVTLETPSVTFVVEEGRTTYAAIVFRVEAVDTVTFEVMSSIPAPFGLPPSLHPPAPVPPGDTAQTGRVWLSFTATAGSVAPITVAVRCAQTGITYDVTVTANVVPARTAAVAIVADRSGSMAQDAGHGLTKRAKLGQALGIMAGLARDTDQMALITFDDQHDVLVPIGDVLGGGGGGTRDAISSAAASPDLDPRGLTGIGAGILDGVGELAGATTDTVALLVVTDGVENVPPTIANVAGAITSHTFAVGIGRPTDVNATALDAICRQTGRYLLITGDLAAEELFRLHKYFLQVHAGVTNDQIVKDPAGELTLGVEHRIPFSLTRAELGADVVLITPLPEVVALRLEAPDGTVIDARRGLPTVAPLAAGWLGGLRLTFPLLPGSDHAGQWTAVVSIDRKRLAKVGDDKAGEGTLDLDAIRQRGALPYSLAVTARSDLELQVRTKHDGEHAGLLAQLDAHGVPFWGEARGLVIVTDPYGRRYRLVLDDLGDGRFRTRLDTPDAGSYELRVIVEGEHEGQRFTREQVVTLATVSGEPAEGRKEPDERPRRPKRPPRRRPITPERAIKTAKPPQPLPPPEEIDPKVAARFAHGHAGNHFPPREERPPPVIWETGPEADKARRALKAAARRRKSPPPAGHGH